VIGEPRREGPPHAQRPAARRAAMLLSCRSSPLGTLLILAVYSVSSLFHCLVAALRASLRFAFGMDVFSYLILSIILPKLRDNCYAVILYEKKMNIVPLFF